MGKGNSHIKIPHIIEEIFFKTTCKVKENIPGLMGGNITANG
jgi:hypothetical protein